VVIVGLVTLSGANNLGHILFGPWSFACCSSFVHFAALLLVG
jgi:hypothetical protein